MGILAQLSDDIYNGIALPLARVGRSEGFQGQAADAARAKLAEMSLRTSQLADRLLQMDAVQHNTVEDHQAYRNTEQLLKTSPLSALTASTFGFLGEMFDDTKIVDAVSVQGDVDCLITDENERWGMNMLDNYFAAPTEELKSSRTTIYESAGMDGTAAMDGHAQGASTILSEGQLSATRPYQFSANGRIALFDTSIPGKFQDKDLNFAGSSLADSLKLTTVGGKTLTEMNSGLGDKYSSSGSTRTSGAAGATSGGGGFSAVPGMSGGGFAVPGATPGVAGAAGRKVSADDIYKDLLSKVKTSEGSSSGSKYSSSPGSGRGGAGGAYSSSQFTPSTYTRGNYTAPSYTPGSYTPGNYTSYTPGNYAGYTPGKYTSYTPGSATGGNYARPSYTPSSYERAEYTRPSWQAGTHTSSAYTPSNYATSRYVPGSYTSSGYSPSSFTGTGGSTFGGGGYSPSNFSTGSGLSVPGAYGSGAGATGMPAALKNAATAGTGGSAAGLGGKFAGASPAGQAASGAGARSGMMPMMPMGMAGAPGAGGAKGGGAGGAKKSNIKNQDGDLYGADVKAVTPVISVQGASTEVVVEQETLEQEKQSFEEFLSLKK